MPVKSTIYPFCYSLIIVEYPRDKVNGGRRGTLLQKSSRGGAEARPGGVLRSCIDGALHACRLVFRSRSRAGRLARSAARATARCFGMKDLAHRRAVALDEAALLEPSLGRAQQLAEEAERLRKGGRRQALSPVTPVAFFRN
jgi:hypothetical protein